MGLFRKKETYSAQLLSAGLGSIQLPTLVAPAATSEREATPNEPAATLTVDASGIEGDAATFVVLPDGSILVEEGSDSPLEALADAVDLELRPPYRARAAREHGDRWTVEAERIEVIQLADEFEGDSMELRRDGVLLRRLDGDLWEVRATAL